MSISDSTWGMIYFAEDQTEVSCVQVTTLNPCVFIWSPYYHFKVWNDSHVNYRIDYKFVKHIFS